MIEFGVEYFHKDKKIIWDPLKVINGHIMVVGGSGTGKTYTIRKIIRELIKTEDEMEFHVIDVHGDIDIGEDVTSTQTFSETSEVGLQPLEISEDLEHGGVRKKVASFINMVNSTNRKLGSNQEISFQYFLYDLYRASGFYQEEPKTWSLKVDPRKNVKYKKQYPTMNDLKMFVKYKLEQLYLGTNTQAVHRLENLNSIIKKLETTLRKLSDNKEDNKDKIEAKLQELKDNAKEEYIKYIDSIKTGRELEEILKYDSKDTIKSIYNRIESLINTGIFKSKAPEFDSKKQVKRYKINSLNQEEQKMFVTILLEKLFFLSKEKGEQNGVKQLIIIDEAHKFISNNSEDIINIIMKEARKFGLGLVFGSQSFNHFSEDIISNTSTKIILGIDEMYQEASAKKLNIEKKLLTYIKPQETALIQIKNKKDNVNFKSCILK